MKNKILKENTDESVYECPLENLVFGIRDRDNLKATESTTKNFVILDRYEKENYLYDPINVYFMLKTNNYSFKNPFDIKFLDIKSILADTNRVVIFNEIISYMDKEIKEQWKMNEELKKWILTKQDLNYISECKEDIDCDYINAYANNEPFTLKYPKYFFTVTGKDLLNIYKLVFKSSEEKLKYFGNEKNDIEFLNKMEY